MQKAILKPARYLRGPKCQGFWLLLMMSGAVVHAAGRAEPTQSIADLPQEWHGIVDYLEGDVFIDDAQADIGVGVWPGSTVVTAEESSCQIVFADRNILHIDENAILLISPEVGPQSFNLESGTLAAVFNNLWQLTQNRVDVHTEVTVLGVRGTAFFVKAGGDYTYVCVCNGILGIADTEGGTTLTVEAYHHSARLFWRNGKTITMKPATLLYHDDASMDELARKIGVEIPWGEASE